MKKKEQTFSEITRRKGSLDRSDLCCCFQSHKDFEKVNIGRGEVASVRLCVCVSVCLSVANYILEASEAIAIKVETVAASVQSRDIDLALHSR